MAGQSAERQKTTAEPSAGVPTIDSLPPELLETKCGFLEGRTLCTARLVCAQFRGAASRCIHSVELSAETLRSRPWTTLKNFPNLSQVTISDLDDLQILVQSPVADEVTRVRSVEHVRLVPPHTRNGANFPLRPLPKLTSLTFSHGHCPPYPQTLRELILGPAYVKHGTMNIVARLTNLTSLQISVDRCGKPFKAVTALTALQRLEIRSELSLIPLLAELRRLTHLQFQLEWGSPYELSDLAALTLLDRLVHLGVEHASLGHASVELEQIFFASTATFTSLRSLDLTLCEQQRSAFEAVCMAPFSQLTALRLDSWGLDASFLPRFDLERLLDLSLPGGVQVDRTGLVALTRATGLTQLELWREGKSVEPEVGMALSRMSRLRALSLGTPAPHSVLETMGCSKTISLLTALTRLKVEGVTTNADVEAFLGLKNLRVLRMVDRFSSLAPSDPITAQALLAVAKLPELRKLDVRGDVGVSGRDLTDHVRAGLNSERHHRGWPPLELNLYARVWHREQPDPDLGNWTSGEGGDGFR